jgi:thiosulfate/3-mercaptopyruvate sulfurtransferase
MALKDPSNDMRITQDIEATLKDLGISGHGPIITHCQTHHRSGLSYMLGRLLGLDIRAYHGSWSEWGNRDDTPIEV